jgi:magnesium-transporting ATPase (P-type)
MVFIGDKQETAVNIGYSCNLLSSDMDVKILNEDDSNKLLQKIKDINNSTTMVCMPKNTKSEYFSYAFLVWSFR